MLVGDLVKALIVEGHPIGVVTKVAHSTRWGAMYHVHPAFLTSPFPFQEHQLQLLSS